MAKHHVNAWLINTGWTGGAYGLGHRMSLKEKRVLVGEVGAVGVMFFSKVFSFFELIKKRSYQHGALNICRSCCVLLNVELYSLYEGMDFLYWSM